MARELARQGILVGHVVIDGGIRPSGGAADDGNDERLDLDAIAAICLRLPAQPRSAWTWQNDARPWVERF